MTRRLRRQVVDAFGRSLGLWKCTVSSYVCEWVVRVAEHFSSDGEATSAFWGKREMQFRT